MHAVTVLCSWVPGTLDRVLVLTATQATTSREILELRQVARRFGREALEALYLRGRYECREQSVRDDLETAPAPTS